ncbi:MAG: GMP synthase subunit A [Candidatus Thermoplasmatota archaeon]|nr:GMP synthase subunit A [Candidatus Thermoplasmatota archaeon]
MEVYVVDNGGQWTHREWRVLRDLGVESKIVPNLTVVEDLQVDGLVLSGGAPRVGIDPSKMGRNGEYLDEIGCPILGICAGHQFMALHFGGETKPARVPEFGKTKVLIEEPGDLFKGLPRRFTVWESHNDEVTIAPKGFKRLASSDNCPVQAMQAVDRPLYGVQFHPEVEHTQHGSDIFKNFLDVCRQER